MYNHNCFLVSTNSFTFYMYNHNYLLVSVNSLTYYMYNHNYLLVSVNSFTYYMYNVNNLDICKEQYLASHIWPLEYLSTSESMDILCIYGNYWWLGCWSRWPSLTFDCPVCKRQLLYAMHLLDLCLSNINSICLVIVNVIFACGVNWATVCTSEVNLGWGGCIFWWGCTQPVRFC